MNSLLFALALVAESHSYRSEQYRFSVDHSRARTFCAQEPPSPAVGFFLSVIEKRCKEIQRGDTGNVIRFWAEYNVIDQADGAELLARSECKHQPELSSRGFAGHLTSYECTDTDGDNVKTKFFAQSEPESSEIDQRINYRAIVYYTKETDAPALLSAVRWIFVGIK